MIGSPLDCMITLLKQEGILYLTVVGKVTAPITITKNAEGKYCYNSQCFLEPSLAVLIAIADQGGLHRILAYDTEG